MKIGLTGGIATGKSTISRHLASLGMEVIDADKVSREVLDIYPEILQYLKETYGDLIFRNGELDRSALGRIIFSDREKREDYLRVIMPRIRQEIERRLSHSDAPFVVLDAPLLFEEGFHKNVDVSLTVWADEKVQRERLTRRDGFTEDEAGKRIRAQMDLEEKKKLSTFVLDNSGKLEDTIKSLDAVLERIGFIDEKKKKEEKNT